MCTPGSLLYVWNTPPQIVCAQVAEDIDLVTQGGDEDGPGPCFSRPPAALLALEDQGGGAGDVSDEKNGWHIKCACVMQGGGRDVGNGRKGGKKDRDVREGIEG